MADAIAEFYGDLLLLRPPTPVTFNKAGANYKSEATHTQYSPREAYDEWLAICEGILALGGDAVFAFEEGDEVFLDHERLQIDAQGQILDSQGQILAHSDSVLTGRVFTANGPWLVVEGNEIRALLPHMLEHRRAELAYYTALLPALASEAGCLLHQETNPYRWEGLADVAVLHDRVIFTHTVKGHYDQGQLPKTLRSSLDGVRYAAQFAGVQDKAVYAELVYPHFHGDTVHFAVRPPNTKSQTLLASYTGGYWDAQTLDMLGASQVLPVDAKDAVHNYAANSRQVGRGVLVPKGVSMAFKQSLTELGLEIVEVALSELFGKAGGGPACATLYLPSNLRLPATSKLRYSVQRAQAHARRERIPLEISVDPGFFATRTRG